MNNKPNDKKSLRNAKTLMTYLLTNKNRFLPNHKKSENMYFDHKTIAKDLNWSERKVYNVFNNCAQRKFIDIVSQKYFASKFSRLIHINLFYADTFVDQKIIEIEAERFCNTKTKERKKPYDALLPYYFDRPYFTNMKYGKKYPGSKMINDIDIHFGMFIDAKSEIENLTPLFPELTGKINSCNRSPCEYVMFNEKTLVKRTEKKYRVSKSCRAYSHFCSSEKNHLRPEILKRLGLNCQYDIPCAVPKMFKLLNFGVFDIDENIRQTIIDEAGFNSVLDEKMLKDFLFRLEFTKSYEQSYNQLAYAYTCKKIPAGIPDLLNYWEPLYEKTHNIMGDTSMQSEIFKYESLLELRTVLALREQNHYTSNVYDCFYSEAPVDTIKNEIANQARILYDDFVSQRI